MGRRHDEQHCRKTLALLHLDQGHAERAARVGKRAVALGEEVGNRFGIDTARMHRASALHRLGRLDEAWAEYERIDLDELPIEPRAAGLGRQAALACAHRPKAVAGLCQRLKTLIQHATLPDADQFAVLLEALQSRNAVLAAPFVEGGASVEIRVVARLAVDALG